MRRQFSFGKVPAIALIGVSLVLAVRSAHAQQEILTFDVGPQRVSNAILDFARQSKIQILIAEDDVRGKQTLGVKGNLCAREALAHILSGTGISIVQDHGGTILLGRKSEIEVSQYEQLPRSLRSGNLHQPG